MLNMTSTLANGEKNDTIHKQGNLLQAFVYNVTNSNGTNASVTGEDGMAPILQWFIPVLVLAGLCVILYIINAIIQNKEALSTLIRAQHHEMKRTRKDHLGKKDEEDKVVMTHVFSKWAKGPNRPSPKDHA